MKEKIRTYIIENILEEEIDLTYRTVLYSDGLLNSMGHLKLLNFLERTFNVSIPAGEVNMDNFDTINQICDFIQNKSTS